MSESQLPITLEMVDGTQVVVPDSLDLITPYVLQEQGDWFEDEIKFLRRLVQPGQTVMDIGANVGVYALSLARRVGPTGQVWAFEPASATAELLAASITANGITWLQLQRQALSDHTGTAWLQTHGQSELNSLGPEQGPGEEVPLTTLDTCLVEFSWKQVDVLKIDAEGEEERILAGGQRFFRELSPLVMFELKAGTELHLELVERFRALGYACYRLVPGLNALMPFDPAAGVDGYLLNLFAAKPDRAEALAAGGWLVLTAAPAPPEPAELGPYHWSRVLTQLPYGQGLTAFWKQQESSETAEATEPLALWAFAQDSAQPIDRRLGALQRSYWLLSEQTLVNLRLTSQSSLARVAAELGERSAALQAQGHLIPGMETGAATAFKEPFLPPCSRFDGLDPAGRMADWLMAASLESDELLGHYSSFFSGSKVRPRLERLHALGFAGTAMAQRLALLNRRFPPRQPASPELERPNHEQIAYSKEAFDLIKAGAIERGTQLLTQAEQMGDTCSVALHLIAKALYTMGDHTTALAKLQRAVELNPNNAGVLLELGIYLKSSGDATEGLNVIQQALWIYGLNLASRDPNGSELFNLGVAYQELEERQQAFDLFEQALAAQGHLESSLAERAKALTQDPARHGDALSILQLIIKHNPANLDAIHNRDKLLMHLGDVNETIPLPKDVLRE